MVSYPFSGPLLKMLDPCPHQQSPSAPLASLSLAPSLWQRLPEMSRFQRRVSRDLENLFFFIYGDAVTCKQSSSSRAPTLLIISMMLMLTLLTLLSAISFLSLSPSASSSPPVLSCLTPLPSPTAVPPFSCFSPPLLPYQSLHSISPAGPPAPHKSYVTLCIN